MDLIQYDKECNYLDLRIRNSHGMLDKCIKDKNNVLKGDTCNLSNSELNSINEVTMKNMNENVYQVFIDNNLSNITDEPLNISLGENADDTNIKKDMDKDNNLNIYPKDVENNIFNVIINGSGNNITTENTISEENREIEDYVINNINTALIEEVLNNRNDINNNNTNQNNNNMNHLDNLTINNININTTLNENLQ